MLQLNAGNQTHLTRMSLEAGFPQSLQMRHYDFSLVIREQRRKKIEKQNKSVKIKVRIFLCFRTRIKFHLLTTATSFLHSNTKKIKSTLFLFPKKTMHFFLITVILKFLNYNV